MSLLPSTGFFSDILNKRKDSQYPGLLCSQERWTDSLQTHRSLNVCINGNRCWYTNFIYMTWNHWDEIRKTEPIIQMFDVRQRLELIPKSPVTRKWCPLQPSTSEVISEQIFSWIEVSQRWLLYLRKLVSKVLLVKLYLSMSQKKEHTFMIIKPFSSQ